MRRYLMADCWKFHCAGLTASGRSSALITRQFVFDTNERNVRRRPSEWRGCLAL